MVISDIKKIKDKNIRRIKRIKDGINFHEKRASDKKIFWFGVLLVVCLSHYYIYATVGVLLDIRLELLWLATGAIAVMSSTAARRLGAPKRALRHISPQSAIYRFGSFWNIFIVLAAIFMFPMHIAGIEPVRSFLAACALSFAVCAYGVYECRTVRRVFLEMETRKPLGESPSLRIVHTTDLHISPFMVLKHVARVVDAILECKPDIVVITGDIVDGFVGTNGETLPYYAPYAAELRRLGDCAPRLGVWAVPGNHDYYEGFDNSVDFIESSGISLLIGETRDLGEVVLVGADDLDHIQRSEINPRHSLSEELLLGLPEEEREKFVLLLRHRPIVEPSTVGVFDLQLSGHTHGGQMFFIPSSRHKMPGHSKGLLSLPDGSKLYVSNGAGFVGPPMRFLAPAEIVVIDVKSGQPL